MFRAILGGALCAAILACASPTSAPTPVAATAVPAPTVTSRAGTLPTRTATAPTPTQEPTPVAAVSTSTPIPTASTATLTVHNQRTETALGSIGKPEAGRHFLVVEVEIVNEDREEFPYNPQYFTLKDSQGFEHSGSATLLLSDRPILTGNLAPGQKVRGFVAFEVPTDAEGFVLSFQPLVTGSFPPLSAPLEAS